MRMCKCILVNTLKSHRKKKVFEKIRKNELDTYQFIYFIGLKVSHSFMNDVRKMLL